MSRMRLGRVLSALISATLVLGVIGAGTASAATVTDAWQAKMGRSGANGTARVSRYVEGNGAITYKLKGMRASTSLPVTIHKGTCSSLGAAVVKLASVRSSSSGAVSRTVSISASQMKLIAAAGKGSSKLAIRVGSGSALRCGAFARLAVAPYVAGTIGVGRLPANVAVDGDNAWVTNWYDNTITRLSTSTNTALSLIPLTLTGNAGPEAIAVANGSLWVTTTELDQSGNALPGSLLRIDPASGAVQATLPAGRSPLAVLATPGAIWVSVTGDGAVKRIDPTTNQEVASIPTGGSPLGLAFGEGSLWVANVADGRVHRIDPTTNQIVTSVQTQLDAFAVAIGAGSVWVSNFGTATAPDGRVSRIDPATNQVVASVVVGTAPALITFTGNAAWVTMAGEPNVVRVSAATNTVTARVPVPGPSWGIASTATAVWAVQPNAPTEGATVVPAGSVTRIGF